MRKLPVVSNFITNFVIYNGLVIILLITDREVIPNLFITFIISLLIFVIPGMSWIGLYKSLDKKASLTIFFLLFFASTLIMLCGNLFLALLKVKSHYFSYLIYILIVINTGILLTGWKFSIVSLMAEKIKSWYTSFLFIFLFIFLYHMAAYYIPPLKDNTLTIQGTAYGLVNYLKPCILNDDGMITYDFAHPLLLHFYGANAILLSGHLKDIKYYYDYSQMARNIQEEGPVVGEVFSVYISSEQFINVKVTDLKGRQVILDKELAYIYLPYAYPNYYTSALLKDTAYKIKDSAEGCLLIENKLKNKNIITRDLYEQIRLRQLLKEEYQKFHQNPHQLCTRVVNIFFFLATLVLIFVIISKLRLVSPRLALFLCILYVSLPEVTVRSVGGSYTAISNFFLISMLYFYLIENRNAKLSFLCAMFGGLSNHKLFLFPLALIIKRFFNKNRPLIVKGIIFGFLSGILIYWAYGLSINPKLFFADHFQRHFINRIFHISQLGYINYPNFFGYWRRFIVNLGWPVFVLGLTSLLILLRSKNRELVIFPFMFFTGAVIFSVVDWKETKHLMLIVIPLIFGIAYLFNLLANKKYVSTIFIKIGILITLFVTIIHNFYLFIVNNGYQMLDRLHILY